jgi:hypothetical protein
MNARVRFVVFVFLLVLGLPALSLAQQTSGVNGVITDKTGGVMSGVQVSLDNSLLGSHQETTTNDLGFYQFLHITSAAGYQLTFTRDGFQKVVLSPAVSYVQSRILSRLGQGAGQFTEPRCEVFSCEAPFERMGDGLVVTLECEQALC